MHGQRQHLFGELAGAGKIVAVIAELLVERLVGDGARIIDIGADAGVGQVGAQAVAVAHFHHVLVVDMGAARPFEGHGKPG